MSWFFIALIAPALWSATNHIDKFLLGKYFQQGGEGALLIFSCAIALLTAPLVGFFAPHVFSVSSFYAAIMIADGMLYIIALIPYMYAMQRDEASVVVPLFQLVAVFGYFFGLFFLHEQLAVHHVFAVCLVVLGAMFLSIDLGGRPKLKGKIFGLMCLSSVLMAANTGIFKLVAVQSDFWTTLFWNYVGFIVMGVLLFGGIASYRKQFILVIRQNSAKALGWNGVNEVLNIVAEMAMKFATLLAPLALVLVVNGLQPVFVLLYGVFLTLFFPHLSRENMSKGHLAQKIIAIAVIGLGTYLIQR